MTRDTCIEIVQLILDTIDARIRINQRMEAGFISLGISRCANEAREVIVELQMLKEAIKNLKPYPYPNKREVSE